MSRGRSAGPPGVGCAPRAGAAPRAPSSELSPSAAAISSVSTTRSSGPNSEDSAGRGSPDWSATTSRSTPVSCSAISSAEANRRARSGSVARTSSR